MCRIVAALLLASFSQSIWACCHSCKQRGNGSAGAGQAQGAAATAPAIGAGCDALSNPWDKAQCVHDRSVDGSWHPQLAANPSPSPVAIQVIGPAANGPNRPLGPAANPPAPIGSYGMLH